MSRDGRLGSALCVSVVCVVHGRCRCSCRLGSLRRCCSFARCSVLTLCFGPSASKAAPCVRTRRSPPSRHMRRAPSWPNSSRLPTEDSRPVNRGWIHRRVVRPSHPLMLGRLRGVLLELADSLAFRRSLAPARRLVDIFVWQGAWGKGRASAAGRRKRRLLAGEHDPPCILRQARLAGQRCQELPPHSPPVSRSVARSPECPRPISPPCSQV